MKRKQALKIIYDRLVQQNPMGYSPEYLDTYSELILKDLEQLGIRPPCCEDFLNEAKDWTIIILIWVLAYIVYKKRHK